MAKKSKNNTPTPPPFILSEADLMQQRYADPTRNSGVISDIESLKIAAQKELIGRSDQNSFSQNAQDSIQPIDWDYFDGTNFTNPDSGLSLNDVMYNNQSGGEVLMHGVGRTVNKAVSEVLKLPGVFGGLIAAPFAEDGKGWETAFNNSYLKTINEASEGINNDFLPVYESDAIKYGDIFTKLSSGTFWATQGADGLGFVLSMLAPGALLKGLNVGKNIIGATGAVGSLGKSTSTYKVLKGIADLGITADRVDNVAITLANTIFEAGSESGNAMENFEHEKPQYVDNYINNGLESLNKQYAQGLINDKEFNIRSQLLQEQAEASFQEQKGLLGRDIFLHNTAILLGPNALQTKLLFGGGAKFLKEASKPKSYQSLLKGFGTGVFSEGLFEEGLQSTVEPMLASSAKKGQLGNNPLNNFNLGELASNYADMISSTDGQSAVILGAVLGGPMNAYGQFRQDQNNYKVTNAILGAYGNHVNNSFNGMIDLYKRDDQGNIKLDRNNKPIIDTAKSANAIKGNMTSEYLNRLHDEAIKNDNTSLHDYLKNITANDLAMSFVNQGETGKDALNEYLESYRTNLQSNESYKPEVKDILLKDTEESIKATKKAFDKMYSSSQAFDLMQKNLLPDPNDQRRQGMSEEEIDNFARLQKVAFLRNLGMRDALNIGIQNSTKELNLLHDTQFPNRRASALEANEESFNEFVSSQPSLVSKYTEVQNMRDANDELMKEFTEMLTNPNYIAKEAEAYMREQRKNSQKTALSTDFNKLASAIKAANNQQSLDDIKLPDTLSTFEEEFKIAKNRRQKELDSKSEIAKREAIIANSTLSDSGMNVTGTFSNPQTDFEIGNDPYTNEAGAGLLYDNAEILAPIEVDYDDLQNSGYAFEINEQGEIIDLDPDQSSLDSNLHSLKSKKELYDESIEDLLNEPDGVIDTEAGGTETGSELTKEETIEEDDTVTNKDGDNVLDSELNEGYTVPVSTGNNTYEGSYNFEGAAEYKDIPDDGVDAETEIVTNNVQILEGQLKEIDETVPDVRLAVHDKNTGEAFSYVLKLPRLIVWNVNQKVLKYFKENRRKHKDDYIVNINKKPYAFNQNAVNIYNNKILKNIPLTAEEYLEVLYKLPLTVNVNNNPDLNINLDAASGVNVVWSEDNKNIISLHKGSLDFANAFTTRLYTINAMINNPTAPVKLLFSKQYGGMLNFNRSFDTGKSISTNIANTNNILDIQDTENKIKFLQNSLSYVDLEGNVRGIANDRIITDRVSTPGIIYLRVNDLAGNPQNVQLTRNKLFDLDSESGANQMDEFVDIVLDTMMQDKTAFELSFDQYLERRADSIDEINSLFEKPLEIMRNTPKYKVGNFTLQDFISFFVHTSSNTRTRLSFQKTYIGFGELAREKTSLSQYLDNNNRLQYSLLDSEAITEEDLLNIRQGVKEYLNLLKHNVSKNYAKDPNYIDYLSNNVLMIDTHPYQDIFVTERTYFNRDQNQVVTEKQPSDIYIKSTPVVEGVNSFQIPNGAFEMITEPNLRMLTERAITLPNTDIIVENVESTIDPEIDTTVYTPVITISNSDFNVGSSNIVVNVDYVNNEETNTLFETDVVDNKTTIKGIDGNEYQILPEDIIVQDTEAGPMEYIWNENRDLIRVIRESNQPNITISNAPKSSLYQVGKSFYRIKGDSNKGYTITNSKTGNKLKSDSPIFKKVLVQHRPDLRDNIYPPKQIKAKPEKEPSFKKWSDALDYLEENGAVSTPYLAALGYFANPKGLVSREGVQNNESGKKWYEGSTSGKTTSKVTTKWEGVAHSLYEQYPNLDSVELASAVEEIMLSFGSRTDVQQSLIDEAVTLRKANEGYMSAEEVEERNRYYIEQEYGPETLAIYDSMEAESNLTGDELVNYYMTLANQQLYSLTQEEQQQLYEEIEEPVLTSDERSTESEVASITESDGNLQETPAEFRTFEQIKQDVQGYENYYNNSNLEQKAQIVTDVLTELGFQEWTDFLDTLGTEQSLDTWFNNSIESLKQSNNATEYLNKICSF